MDDTIRVVRQMLVGSLVVAVAVVGGCSDDDGGDHVGAGSTATTTTDSTVADDTTTFTTAPDEATTVPTSTPLADGEPEGTDLADGRHPALLTGLDVDARTVEVDVIQFLTGDEARAAYLEDDPADPDGPPNDYYVVNDNPQVRTLTVSPDVEVLLVRLEQDANADSSPGTFEELPDYTAGWAADDGTLWYSPFWLTVENGVVVGIEEQYVP